MRTIAHWFSRARSRHRSRARPPSAKHPGMIEALEGRRLFSATEITDATIPAASATPAAAALTAPLAQPSVRSVNPANGSTSVLRDGFISVEVNLPNGGIDPSSLTDQT